MIASSYVGWTVAGWSPGDAWIPSRKRFQSTTRFVGRASCVACARLVEGAAATAAQVMAATVKVVSARFTMRSFRTEVSTTTDRTTSYRRYATRGARPAATRDAYAAAGTRWRARAAARHASTGTSASTSTQ